MSGYSLTFAFPDQSPSFAHGFCCGRLWEQMRGHGACAISATVPTEVRETIEAMAMSLGWVETIDDLDEHWIAVTLVKPSGEHQDNSGPPIVPQISQGPTP